MAEDPIQIATCFCVICELRRIFFLRTSDYILNGYISAYIIPQFHLLFAKLRIPAIWPITAKVCQLLYYSHPT